MPETKICEICNEEVTVRGYKAHTKTHESVSNTGITVKRDPNRPNRIILNRLPSESEKPDVQKQIGS